MIGRTSVITDWSTRDEDLPDVSPGETFEGVCVPQNFVVLFRVLVKDLILARLQIGPVTVPFELHSAIEGRRSYALKIADEALRQCLVKVGAAVTPGNGIALTPGSEVHLLLRNDGASPVRLRAALIVQEEELSAEAQIEAVRWTDGHEQERG